MKAYVVGGAVRDRLLGEPVTIERHRTTGEQPIDHVGHIARIMPVKAGVLTSPTLVQKQRHRPSVQCA